VKWSPERSKWLSCRAEELAGLIERAIEVVFEVAKATDLGDALSPQPTDK
jgi:hypothetical protein